MNAPPVGAVGSDDAVQNRDQNRAVRIAVLIPCHNEEASVANVVRALAASLPEAVIYVYDNNSSDRTAAVAAAAGAIVRHESMQGKGHVVCRMFSEVEADVYLLIDGDATYDAGAARAMVERLIAERLDMVSAARVETAPEAYRRGHRFGNRMLSGLVAAFFGNRFCDMLSGYRAFSRRFVKSFPALSQGFEIETQLTVHALEMQMPVAEIEAPYFERRDGSVSKLHTFRDGWRILGIIAHLIKNERPLLFFSAIFMILAATALALAWPIFVEFAATGLVPRFPTAFLAMGVTLLAFFSLFSGIILESVAQGRRETKRLHYLAVPPLPADAAIAKPARSEAR